MDKKSPSQHKKQAKPEKRRAGTQKMDAKTVHIFVCRYDIFVFCANINNGVSKALSHRCYLDGGLNGNRIDPRIIFFLFYRKKKNKIK